ncbi:Flp family type IVb pilin [Denitrificimonas caeni]|uniref:Flp family type IVb pilin n=1 Tax=Denitrificimonas caeni TaxID=521720 RepID=UPI001964869A|nr:Flp family type IVb pilin [Denitrificimonas caeni]
MLSKLILLQLKISSFFKREDGATAIEYAIIAGLIAVVIIAGATALGGGIDKLFTDIANKLGLISVD